MESMNISEAIRKRHSCRSFTGEALPEDVADGLKKRIASADGLMLIDGSNGRVGTYGIVSGSVCSIALAGDATKPEFMKTAGDAEEIVLWLTEQGIGSVWLGGTFKVSGVNDSISAVVALGVPANKMRLVDRIMHRAVSSNNRKPFDELFKSTSGGFGSYREPLEMMRLAPSAKNAQPWRAYVDDDTVHFYSTTNDRYTYIDMGIALRHFSLTAPAGVFVNAASVPTPFSSVRYITSWKKK